MSDNNELDKINKVLDETIRPHIQSDGGDAICNVIQNG